MLSTRNTAIVLALAAPAPLAAHAQTRPRVDEHLLSAFTYRNLGPFRMGARVSDIAVPSKPGRDHLYTFYVSFWTGGLWKTTNNGTTFEPVFDNQSTFPIGDVTLAPSNPDIVWVGTGDAFTSRSSYAGNGVYKSTDAAKTWTNMGLSDTHHIARIIINPTNPDIVYVAAMGHLYSDNPERGVFKTTDGGKTWSKVLYVSERVGVIDLVMDPRDPAVLYAATYDKQRLPWQIVNGGPGSGIYKTTDAGKTWKKLGNGLPDGRIGRIGLDISLSNPDVLYAVIENENSRTTPLAVQAGRGGGGGPQRSTIGGEVYRTTNAGETWTKTSPDDYDVSPKGAYYFSQIRVNPGNDQDIYVTQDGLRHSIDGGKTWNGPRMFPRMFGDVRYFWIDPDDPRRMIQGSDGGSVRSVPTAVRTRRRRTTAVRRATRTRIFRSARSTRSAPTWRTRTTSTPVSRITNTGKGPRTARSAECRSMTGSRWGMATASLRLSTRRTRAGSTPRASMAATFGSIRNSATRRTLNRSARRDSRRIAGCGNARS